MIEVFRRYTSEPRERVYAPHSDEVITQQHTKQESDINFIVERFTIRNEPLPVSSFQPTYGDATGAEDLATAIELAQDAHARFEREIPIAVREAVGHDPVRLLEALSNEAETEALVKRGLDFGQGREREPAAQPAEATTEAPKGAADEGQSAT